MADIHCMERTDEYWLTRPNPTDDDIDAVCRAWVEYQHERSDADDEDPLWWAVDAVLEAGGVGGLPLLWRIIVGLCSVVDPEDEHVVAMIGIQPIEDAYFEFGDEALDLMESVAEHNPVLLAALRSASLYNPGAMARLDAFVARQDRGPTS
jgi:hypothetical protein